MELTEWLRGGKLDANISAFGEQPILEKPSARHREKAMGDPLLLARIQFAANISFHILFPTISIALGWFLFYFKVRHIRSGEERWAQAYGFWVKVFALTFALGAVSGITMSFQFGTNWPGFMKTVGNIAGPLLAYEVMTAFFLEATFLGVMLFGGSRVSPRMHAMACFLVAFGTTMSAFWIMALNSWMQTPAGYEMRGGKAFALDWWAVVFNPSMPYRLTHMLLASFATAAFLMAGLSAYRWLKGDRSKGVAAALVFAVKVAAAVSVAQIVAGDMHGLNTLKHQPAKVAAMEGLWHDEKGAPLLLFAVPDEQSKSNKYEVGIPKLASLILRHDPEGEIKGLESFEGRRPKVLPVFFAFRAMVGMGVAMLLFSWTAAWSMRRARGGVEGMRPWLAKGLVAMAFSGWVATLAGWYVAETGRQPFLVYGLLTVQDAASKTAGSGMVATSLAMYLCLYAVLVVAYVWTLFMMARKVAKAEHAGAGESVAAIDLGRRHG